MKKDCSNIFTFVHEWERRRQKSDRHYDPAKNIGIGKIKKEDVEELQKWSDEQPKTTRKDHFLKQFPGADVNRIQPCYLNYGCNSKIYRRK